MKITNVTPRCPNWGNISSLGASRGVHNKDDISASNTRNTIVIMKCRDLMDF